MKSEIGLYFRLTGVQIRSQLSYRISLVTDVIATAMITALGIASLAFIFRRFGSIAGWKLEEVAFLYGMVEAAFGLMDMLFSGFDPQTFGRHVRLGRLDQMLLRPVNITLQILGSDFVMRRLGRIIQGFVVLSLAISFLDIQWTWGKILYLPVVFLSMVLFFGGLFIIGSTITFWTLESIEVVNIFTYGGSEMMSYPMHIYQDWLRGFFTYILPAIFLNYYPALFFLEKPDPFNMPQFVRFLSPVVGIGLFVIALAFWNFGLKHYQSSGT